MAIITFQNQHLNLEKGETVLDCFERHGLDFPHSCKAGVCQSCLAKVTVGKVQTPWQRGLKEIYITQDYFLPCIAKPNENISIELPNSSEISTTAVIHAIEKLTPNVISLRLLVENLDVWVPGQYLNLINSDGLIRSYSIANLPLQDGFIELHIKLYPQGMMSNWLSQYAKVGLQLLIRGPMGNCFYNNLNNENFNMILAGTGTGLAPLLAIVRDALEKNHPGKINLLHGGITEKDIYYHDYLVDLAKSQSNFSYHCCVLQSNGRIKQASIDAELKQLITDSLNTKVYICGPEETAKQLKKQVFLMGVPSKNIFSDIFITKSIADRIKITPSESKNIA